MNFKTPSLGKFFRFGLSRRNLLINVIVGTGYSLIETKFANKPFFVIGKLCCSNLKIGGFVVATTDCSKLHPRLKAQMLGRIIGIVDSYQSLVMIKFYPTCFHDKKYNIPFQLFSLNFFDDNYFYEKYEPISKDQSF